MRFTILTQYYPPEIGAAQVRLSAFALELQRLGHQVHVVTAMPSYPEGVIHSAYRSKWWMREQVDGIPVTRTWIYPATGRIVLNRLMNYFSFSFSCLFALAMVPRADILFVESPPIFLCLSAWLMAALRRQKFCINVSDLWPDSVVALGIMREGAFIRAARWLEYWLYRRAWRICAVTEGIVETLATEKGMPREKLLFLPNGVDINLFAPRPPDPDAARRLGLEGKFVFAYTGTLGYAQGLDVIIHAAEQIRDRPDVMFLFVGDGPEKVHLQSLARSLDSHNVVFLQAQPLLAMPSLFALATACIVPLRDLKLFLDARPSKIFPALSCAKPIIYSGAGEAARLVEKAHCGIVTLPENALALAEAVTYMVDHPAETTTMGQQGRALVERSYNWSSIVNSWLTELDYCS